MRILVTGGAGYIGSILTKKLLHEGYNVTVFDNLQFGGESLISLLGNAKFKLICGDIRQIKEVTKAVENIDCIVHLAALVGEPVCKIDPKATKDINFKGTQNVCGIGKNSGVKRFIFISTCSNYGISPVDQPATEEATLHPISLYAETKIAAEKYVIQQASEDFSTCILRLATAYGISPRMRFDLLVNEIVRDAFVDKEITVYQPEVWRPFIHTLDIAKAVITTIKAAKNKITGQTFNVGNKNYQKKEIIEYVKQYIPECGEKTIEARTDKRDYSVSFEKVKKILGFQAEISLDQGIKEMLNALELGIFKNPKDYRYTNVNWPTI